MAIFFSFISNPTVILDVTVCTWSGFNLLFHIQFFSCLTNTTFDYYKYVCPHGTYHTGSFQALLRLCGLECCRLGDCRGRMLSIGSCTLQYTQGTLYAHRISHLHYPWRSFPHGGRVENIRTISISVQYLQHRRLKKSKTKPIFRIL